MSHAVLQTHASTGIDPNLQGFLYSQDCALYTLSMIVQSQFNFVVQGNSRAA